MSTAKKDAKKIRVTLKKSLIGRLTPQRKVIQALGLRRLNSSVEHYATPIILGMINKVSHMVSVEELV